MRSVNLLLCGDARYRCMDLVGDIWLASLILIPVAFFSLLTYFPKEEIFHAWLRFSYWWVPLSYAVVLFSSSRSPANLMGISDQAAFGIITGGLYIIISLIIIIRKYFATRHGK